MPRLPLPPRSRRRLPVRPRRSRSEGYTLLELLVVLVLVGLTGALLSPLALRAKAKARMETCVDNLRQLSQAARTYARDYDDWPVPASIAYPRFIPGVTWYERQAYWPVLVRPYLKDEAAYWCPGSPVARLPFGPGLEWKTYAINAHVSARVPGRPDVPLRPLSAVRQPENVGLLTDSAGVCCLYVEEFLSNPKTELPPLNGIVSSRATHPAHDGGINIVFLDGHLDWLPVQDYADNEEVGRRIWGGYDMK